MSIINSVQQTSRLRKEGTDLTIVPSRENRATIVHKSDSVALETWNLDTEKLLSSFGVPYTNIIDRASSKEVRVASRESDVIDTLIVACVS